MISEIYLDIESLPSQTPGARESIIADLSAPKNYKDEEKIAKWKEEHADAAYRATALDGARGEIACIGLALNDEEPLVIGRDDGSEEDTLHQFFDFIGSRGDITDWDTVWVGHNLDQFDLLFIWHRCVIKGIHPPTKVPKPGSRVVYDTMHEWAGGKYNRGGYVSQDKICSALGTKRDHGQVGSGADVYDAWAARNYDGIAQHCTADILELRDNYRRMTFRDD